MRWVSPFIHQPGEHGCQSEAKWESSPSSVFVPQTLISRFPSLIGWLWNAQKLARKSPSLSGRSRIKSRLFFFPLFLFKAVLLASEKTEQRYYFTFHRKLPGRVETLNLSCKSIQSTSCLKCFKYSTVTLNRQFGVWFLGFVKSYEEEWMRR